MDAWVHLMQYGLLGLIAIALLGATERGLR